MVKEISLAKENTNDVSLGKLFGLFIFFKVNKSLNEGNVTLIVNEKLLATTATF